MYIILKWTNVHTLGAPVTFFLLRDCTVKMMRPLIWGIITFLTSFTSPKALAIFQPKEFPHCPLQTPWFFSTSAILPFWLFIFWRSYNFVSVSPETHAKILEICAKISSSLLHSLDAPTSNSDCSSLGHSSKNFQSRIQHLLCWSLCLEVFHESLPSQLDSKILRTRSVPFISQNPHLW